MQRAERLANPTAEVLGLLHVPIVVSMLSWPASRCILTMSTPEIASHVMPLSRSERKFIRHRCRRVLRDAASELVDPANLRVAAIVGLDHDLDLIVEDAVRGQSSSPFHRQMRSDFIVRSRLASVKKPYQVMNWPADTVEDLELDGDLFVAGAWARMPPFFSLVVVTS